jgi:hypothetical protein
VGTLLVLLDESEIEDMVDFFSKQSTMSSISVSPISAAEVSALGKSSTDLPARQNASKT